MRPASFAEADREELRYYRSLTPQARLAILLELVRRYNESHGDVSRGLERVCRVVALEDDR